MNEPPGPDDKDAVQQLWERYFARLVALVRKKLEDSARQPAGKEDVALRAFVSFCRNAEAGRFPRFPKRGCLWLPLLIITARKVGEVTLEGMVSGEPSPAFAAKLAEKFRRLLRGLGESDLKSVALWKMEGYTNEEIAGKLACVARTVKRKLRVIRITWAKECAP